MVAKVKLPPRLAVSMDENRSSFCSNCSGVTLPPPMLSIALAKAITSAAEPVSPAGNSSNNWLNWASEMLSESADTIFAKFDTERSMRGTVGLVASSEFTAETPATPMAIGKGLTAGAAAAAPAEASAPDAELLESTVVSVASEASSTT